APGIDTGMGLERTAAILQGVDTIHHTDLFAPIINAISAAKNAGDLRFDLSTPQLHLEDPTTKPLKVVADHVRAAIFLASDGVTPGNQGRDYMLRRFIRRAYLNGRTLGLDKPFLHRLVPVVEQGYGAIYPELTERRDIISDLILREEERFGVTIESGMNRLDDLIADAKSKNRTQLSGAEVFSLYSSQGFPPELTADILADNGLSFDQNEFQNASESHSKISGSAVGEYQKREFDGLETKFLGYEATTSDAKIVAIRGDKIVLDQSPFYAESGGQSGDTGEIVGENGRAQILDTKKEGKTWVHFAQIEGELREGDAVTATVNSSRRRAIERAHSSTHLLHASLRQHLGKHVEQRGSLVEGDRLRFDFVHFSPISAEELETIEKTVNAEILASLPVEIAEKTLAEAKAMGAMALFGEKYGETVRTVKMGDFSLELCGGTHLPTTSAAGLLRIVSEGGVGANVRRIEALTGTAALEHDREQAQKLREIAAQLGARPENALASAQKLASRNRELEKQLAEMQRQLSGGAADEILAGASEIKGFQFVASRAPEGLSADALRELADKLADKLDGVVVLASENGGKVSWAVKASKSAVGKGAHAGNLVKQLAQITGGGGGGRPDFAFAGGKDVSKIDEAINQAAALV
ncbi:MAG TPA: alanine--tRNA ligase, partial [Abditibacterium sp.]